MTVPVRRDEQGRGRREGLVQLEELCGQLCPRRQRRLVEDVDAGLFEHV